MMKQGLVILCALLCMQGACGFPRSSVDYGTMLTAKANFQPISPKPNGMAFMQVQNAKMNGQFSVNAQFQTPTNSRQLKSTAGIQKLSVTFRNGQDKTVNVWWANYAGNLVHYNSLSPGQYYKQRTYATHPWLLADDNGNIIATVIPKLSNLDITIQTYASW